MFPIGEFSKTLLKKILGRELATFLHKIIIRLSPSDIKDMILYYFVRLKMSKQSYTKLSSRKKPHILILIEKSMKNTLPGYSGKRF